ncbi:hypothetical protein Nepgr_015280 [Nepenthes gracilis]|uniref:Uncharacterized protein n=1 Tax=Nepenthes gracilis TaxID=150966 RepID=A0AAD3XQZ0_NEPGR|nr:hypothetical protein Nepgr_015280 [Nepenthes gracilis]
MLFSCIPCQAGDLANLIELDLSSYQLDSSLPLKLKGMRSLRKMVTGNDGLVGVLPDGVFSALTLLEFVDLSPYHFVGESIQDYLQSDSSVGVNCRQKARKQRTLVKCAAYYASEGFNFVVRSKIIVRKSHRRTSFFKLSWQYCSLSFCSLCCFYFYCASV